VVTHGGVITLARLMRAATFGNLSPQEAMRMFRMNMLDRPVGNCEMWTMHRR